MPECDIIKSLHQQLLNSQSYSFPQRGAKINVSNQHGVYIIYSHEDIVLHVGTTKRAKNGLNQRLNNQKLGVSSFYRNYFRGKKLDLSVGYKFKFIIVENARQRTLLEALTTGFLCLDYIGIGESRINNG
ncbi:MAG: hypothetical protein WAR79_08930 [Melioribacteraceae bacterium]